MVKTNLYRYLGTNGIITSSVYLEGIYSVKLCRLTADEGKCLIKGDQIEQMVIVPVDEANEWQEVNIGQI